MVAFKAAKLTAAHAALWAQFLAAKERCQGASKAEDEKKKAQTELIAGFGDELFGKLPHGTILQRARKTRAVAAKEACEQGWWVLSVAQEGK